MSWEMPPPLFSLFGGEAKCPLVVMPRACREVLSGKAYGLFCCSFCYSFISCFYCVLHHNCIKLNWSHTVHPVIKWGEEQIPEGISKDPEARLDAAVIALKTEHVQFHIPLLAKADWEFRIPSIHSKNWSTLHTQQNDMLEALAFFFFFFFW